MLNNLGRVIEGAISGITSIDAVLLDSQRAEVGDYDNCVTIEFSGEMYYKDSKDDYMVNIFINVFSKDDIECLTIKRELDKALYNFKGGDSLVKVFRTLKNDSNRILLFDKKYNRFTAYNSYNFGVEDLS